TRPPSSPARGSGSPRYSGSSTATAARSGPRAPPTGARPFISRFELERIMHDRSILLVEDNPDDEALTRRALAKNNIQNEIVVARDGAEALAWLFGTGPHAGRAATPALVPRDRTRRDAPPMSTAKPVTPALRGADAELEALFAAISDVILVLDADGRYVKIPPTNTAMLYRPAAELLGRTLHDVFDRPQADHFLGLIRQALAQRETVHFEYSLPIGGRTVWFVAAISPMAADRVVLVARAASERGP